MKDQEQLNQHRPTRVALNRPHRPKKVVQNRLDRLMRVAQIHLLQLKNRHLNPATPPAYQMNLQVNNRQVQQIVQYQRNRKQAVNRVAVAVMQYHRAQKVDHQVQMVHRTVQAKNQAHQVHQARLTQLLKHLQVHPNQQVKLVTNFNNRLYLSNKII